MSNKSNEPFIAWGESGDDGKASREAAIHEDIAHAVDKLNNWCEEHELSDEQVAKVFSLVAKAFFELFRAVIGDNVIDEQGVKRIIQRFFAIAWTVQPDLLKRDHTRKRNASLRHISQFTDCSFCWLSMISEEYAKKHNFQGSSMKTQNSRDRYKIAANAYWERVRVEELEAEGK